MRAWTHIALASVGTHPSHSVQQCRAALEQELVALQLTKPVHYLLSEYNAFEQTHFFKLQRGGMVAW